MPTEKFDLSQNIIAMLGLQDLPEEKRLALLEKMTDLIQKRLVLRLAETLTEADAKEAEKMANEPEKMFAWMIDRVPNFQQMLKEEIKKVKDELQSAIKA